MNPNDVFPDCFQHRYASVFMLHRFPYQKDGVRVADDDTADYLETWMVRDYTALGYDPIWVPVLPPAERLAFVLERL
jgi:predicted ATPase